MIPLGTARRMGAVSSWAALVFAIVCLCDPRPLQACAACGCGDPTLTVVGTEKPFAGRLRLAVGTQYRTDQIGEPRVDQLRLSEWRFDLQAAWAPHERLFLLVSAPIVSRTVSYVNLAKRDSTDLGDIELRAKYFIFQDREIAPHHLLALVGGVKLPTAPLQNGADGRPLPVEAQAGTGSFDPIAGLAYAWFRVPWSAYASVTGTYPVHPRQDFRASPSLRTTTTLQYQISPAFAGRFGIDTRIDGKARELGAPDRDSGGFIAFLSPEAAWQMAPDLVLFAFVRVPVVQDLRGFHHEGMFAGGGLAYDFF